MKKEEPPRSYEWEETPARLILHLRPNDGHELGREIGITGVTYDGDVPKAAVVREKELSELPPPLAAVVQGLKDSLPDLRKTLAWVARGQAAARRRRPKPYPVDDLIPYEMSLDEIVKLITLDTDDNTYSTRIH